MAKSHFVRKATYLVYALWESHSFCPPNHSKWQLTLSGQFPSNRTVWEPKEYLRRSEPRLWKENHIDFISPIVWQSNYDRHRLSLSLALRLSRPRVGKPQPVNRPPVWVTRPRSRVWRLSPHAFTLCSGVGPLCPRPDISKSNIYSLAL